MTSAPPLRTAIRPLPCGVLLSVALGLALVTGCAGDPNARKPTSHQEFVEYSAGAQALLDRATEAMAKIDAELKASQILPPAERLKAQQAFGPRLVDLVATCRGTKLENRAWYLLAHWRFNFHDDGVGVDEALAGLYGCRQDQMKNLGRAVEAQHRLRQGRLPEARRLAEQVREEFRAYDTDTRSPGSGSAMDPFASLVELVELAERARAGTPLPAISGARVDPATAREFPFTAPAPDTWQLVLSVGTFTAETAFQVRRLAEAAAGRPCRIVVLARDASPLVFASQAAALPPLPTIDLLYARTVPEAITWAKDWGTALDPLILLVDPGGRLAAVAVRPADLARLIPAAGP